MRIIEALLLGLLQGLTEFLPISSSGHLVLLPYFLGWALPPLVFDTTVHLGTLVAVVAIFWRDLLDLFRAWVLALRHRRPLETSPARLAWWILLGTLPAALAGLLLEEIFEVLFGTPPAAGGFLLLTALLLLLGELLARQRRDLTGVTWLDGLLIGIAQAVAIAPGLSRSGATIATGLFRGLTREAATRFSFLLSVPIVAGTGLLQLFRLFLDRSEPASAPVLLVGFLAAALSGYAAIRLLLAYVRRRPLYPFALYCLLLGGLALLCPLLGA